MAINPKDTFSYVPFSGADSGDQLPSGIVREGNSYYSEQSADFVGPPNYSAFNSPNNQYYDGTGHEGIYETQDDGVTTYSDISYLIRDVDTLNIASISSKAYRDAQSDLANAKNRKGHVNPEKLKTITTRKTVKGFNGRGDGNSVAPTGAGSNSNTGGGTSAGLTSPVKETKRTVTTRTLVSDDGLVEIDVEDVLELDVEDAAGRKITFKFTAQT